MGLMNIKQEDMWDGVKVLGAAGFLDIALDADSTMFIG
jgi:predicted peroxiredoxin